MKLLRLAMEESSSDVKPSDGLPSRRQIYLVSGRIVAQRGRSLANEFAGYREDQVWLNLWIGWVGEKIRRRSGRDL